MYLNRSVLHLAIWGFIGNGLWICVRVCVVAYHRHDSWQIRPIRCYCPVSEAGRATNLSFSSMELYIPTLGKTNVRTHVARLGLWARDSFNWVNRDRAQSQTPSALSSSPPFSFYMLTKARKMKKITSFPSPALCHYRTDARRVKRYGAELQGAELYITSFWVPSAFHVYFTPSFPQPRSSDWHRLAVCCNNNYSL